MRAAARSDEIVDVSPAVRSADASSPLFSCAFTVEQMTMSLLSRSNQNGAPSVNAKAVMNQPGIVESMKVSRPTQPIG